MPLTLTDFRNQVLDNLDDTSQDAFTDTRLDRLINRAKDWVERDLAAMDEGYNVTTTTWAISATTTTKTLPSDFRQLLYMQRTDVSPAQPCTIIDWRTQRDYQRSAYERYSSPGAFPVAYIWHNSACFLNVDSAISIAMDYSYLSPDMTITTNTLINPAMDHAVVLGATYMALMQEASPDAGAWKGEFEQERRRIVEFWTQRNRQDSRSVRMVD